MQASRADEATAAQFQCDCSVVHCSDFVVTAIYPPHELEAFTDMFWGRIQDWRALEGRP